MFALVIRHAHRIVEHLHRGNGPFLNCYRFVGRMHLLGQFVQMAAVLQRDTHKIGDNVGRQFARDIADQVAFAARDYPVDDLTRQLLDPGPPRLRGARFELLAHQHPVAGMLRRVHHQHHVARGRQRRFVAVADHYSTRKGGIGLGIASDRAHVVIACYSPESAPMGLGMPIYGVVTPEPAELIVGLALRERGGTEQVDCRSGHLDLPNNGGF